MKQIRPDPRLAVERIEAGHIAGGGLVDVSVDWPIGLSARNGLRDDLAFGHTPSMERRNSFAGSAADGCYEASRASALSGVPRTTVYWWARNGVVVPTVSPVREKLWSFSDLMALRMVTWLRHTKPSNEGVGAASPMRRVRQALALLDALDLDPWSADMEGRSPILVDAAGRIYVRTPGEVFDLDGQRTLLPENALGLTAPFASDGLSGPNLLRPRPLLRIVPSKVSGEPHVVHSRLTTLTIAALAARGFSARKISEMYDEPVEAMEEAIDLEQQLASSVLAA